MIYLKILFKYIFSHQYHKSIVVHYECKTCEDKTKNSYYYIIIPTYFLGFTSNMRLLNYSGELKTFTSLEEAREYICDNLLTKDIYTYYK